MDLRLGEYAWALRCSFLPDSASTVEEKVKDLAFERIDLRDGATLERDRPYLVPLIEELRLPGEIRAKANPKSSTGRLDVFTRVLTDRNHRFMRSARVIRASSTWRSSRAPSRSASRRAWRSTRCA
jgi:dCTP deaminase